MKLRQEEIVKIYSVAYLASYISQFKPFSCIYIFRHNERVLIWCNDPSCLLFVFLRSSFHFYSSKQTSTNEGFVHWEVIYCRYIAMTVAHFPIVIRPVWHANVFNIKDFRKSERIYFHLQWNREIHFPIADILSKAY